MSASVRYYRGSWVVGVSTKDGGKRKRAIVAFGCGSQGKAAAEAYRDEISSQTKSDKFWKRQHATFRELWRSFDAQLVGPVPGPSTIEDYGSMAKNYLLPVLSDKRLRDIDAAMLINLGSQWLTQPGLKAAQGTGKPLAPRTVAKFLILIGTVFRHGKAIGWVTTNPAADTKKPRADKKLVYEFSVEDVVRLRASFDVFEERLMVELDIRRDCVPVNCED